MTLISLAKTNELPRRRWRRLVLLLALIASLWPAASVAQSAGDPKKGLAYAEQICAECHAVGLLGVVSPRPQATPFVVIARVPGINERSLAVFLQTPHSNMPNLIVTGEDRDNLIAYMMSLKKD